MKLNENTKLTLTIGQLKRLVNEAVYKPPTAWMTSEEKEFFANVMKDENVKYAADKFITNFIIDCITFRETCVDKSLSEDETKRLRQLSIAVVEACKKLGAE